MPGSEISLVVGDRAALGEGAVHVIADDPGDDDADLAVVDQRPVAGTGVLREAK
jgi:hypothetical protein